MYLSWEKDDNFDNLITKVGDSANAIQWVDTRGNPISVSGERAGNDRLEDLARLVQNGEVVGHVDEILFPDPDHFFCR